MITCENKDIRNFSVYGNYKEPFKGEAYTTYICYLEIRKLTENNVSNCNIKFSNGGHIYNIRTFDIDDIWKINRDAKKKI